MKFSLSLCTLFLFIVCISCKQEKEATSELTQFEFLFTGKTMGTTYMVKYIDEMEVEDLKAVVDSLLIDINQSVSTYIPASQISLINSGDVGSYKVDQHFMANFIAARQIYNQTKGSFNPAIMPLVNYWGFGFERLENDAVFDTVAVQNLQALVNFDSFTLDQNQVQKTIAKAQLDFSAIAKGYAVDQIASLLEKNGLENYLVEIGGEIYASGLNIEGKNWVTGIRKPIPEEKNTLIERIPLANQAMATSGNYENFKELEGKKTIAHTIDPSTGFPQSIDEELLSTTVIANNCMAADAFATAFKVMGLEKSKLLLEDIPSLRVFFVYRDQEGKIQTFSTINSEK